jgi:hypothetical protein
MEIDIGTITIKVLEIGINDCFGIADSKFNN